MGERERECVSVYRPMCEYTSTNATSCMLVTPHDCDSRSLCQRKHHMTAAGKVHLSAVISS